MNRNKPVNEHHKKVKLVQSIFIAVSIYPGLQGCCWCQVTLVNIALVALYCIYDFSYGNLFDILAHYVVDSPVL